MWRKQGTARIRKVLSLRTRLVGTMAILFLCGTGVMYLAARAYGQTAADLSYDRLLTGSALSIAETLAFDAGQVQVDLPYAALDMLSAAPEDRVFYRVYGPGTQTVTGYADLPLAPDAGPGRRPSLSEPVRYFDASYRGELVRFAVLGRQIAEPGLNGWIWIQVGQTRRARDELAQELVVGALLPIGLITVLALSLVWFGIARALSPLEGISRDLGRREPFDLHAVQAPVPQEVQPLVNALNTFMRRLEGNMGMLRAFIADAAHQMRTPLAALRAQAQMALDEDDPVQMRRGLRAVDRNAARLTRLLNQLLSDATVTHRSDLKRFEQFDLTQVVRKALNESVPMAGEARVEFATTLAAAPWSGDALLLGEALKNLIDNALHHGHSMQDDSLVEVSLSEQADAYVLSVADRGPGIPAAHTQHLFQRFARGDSDRPGAGLGLAIVKQVVDSHGGQIELSEREGGGLDVRIRLPRNKA